MAVPHHADLELLPGDDWVVPFALTDVNGGPLDLTNASLQWILLDPDGNQVADLSPQITTNTPKTAGTGAIAVNETVTATLFPGRYTDALRVSISGAVSTVWIGSILVDADPFAPPPPAPAPQVSDDALIVLPQWWWWPRQWGWW